MIDCPLSGDVMTDLQGWIIIAELALMIFALAPRSKPKSIEIEITKVGDGFVHGRDRWGHYHAVPVSRLPPDTYPKVGNIVTFS